MQDVETASLLAVFLFFTVLIFFVLERFINSKYNYSYQSNTKNFKEEIPSTKNKFIIHFFCLVPIIFGFIVPILFILGNVVYEFERIEFVKVFTNTSCPIKSLNF